MNINRVISTCVFMALTSASVTVNAASAKVNVCHFDADSGLFHVINVSANAVSRHMSRHGDSYPGDYFSDFDGDGYGDTLGNTHNCPNPGMVDNDSDAFPDDPTEWIDSDGDGLGDNSDACPATPGDGDNGCPIPTFVLGSDIVTGNGTPGSQNNNLSILLGDGNNGFSISNYSTFQWSNHSVAVGDFDNNGRDDIVVVHYDGQVWVEFNGVTDGVNLTNAAIVTGNPPQGVAAGIPVVADFNADGWQDVAVKTFGNISVLLNDQSGSFAAELKFPTAGEPRSLAAADVDGDGNQDIVAVGEAGHGAVAIHYGDGSGGFTTQFIGVGDDPSGNVKLGDIDGDGDVDIITGSWIGKVLFYLNDGGGSFTPASLDAQAGVNKILLANDLDGDGAIDLVTTANPWNAIHIRFNDGSGGFSVAPDTYSVGSAPFQAAMGDFNEDGQADIATVNLWPRNISILPGMGSGIFGVSINVGPLPTAPESIAVGNFD